MENTILQYLGYGIIFITSAVLMLFFAYLMSRLISHAIMQSIKANLKIDFGGNNVKSEEPQETR